MELEERWATEFSPALISHDKGKASAAADTAPISSIPEAAQFYNMGMSSESTNYESTNRVTVSLNRCRDIEALLVYDCGHSPVPEDLELHSRGPCPNNPHWETWVEEFDF